MDIFSAIFYFCRLIVIDFIWHKVPFHSVANLSDKTTSFTYQHSASIATYSLRPHQTYLYTNDTELDEMAGLLLEIYGSKC